MRIGVIGAGSMGSVIGGKLARTGAKVMLYDRDSDLVAAVGSHGLKVRDPTEEFAVSVPATTNIRALSEIDLAVVLVDGNGTADIAPQLAPILSSSGCALTLQNGIGNVEILSEWLGSQRVLGGSTFVSATMIAPGYAYNTNIGETVLGEIQGPVTSRAEKIVSLFRSAGFPARASDNVIGHIWSKFALNCALNPMSALTGLRPGEVVRHAEMSALLDGLITEIESVVRAKGIRLPEEDLVSHIRMHAFTRYNRPSMLQHVEAGKQTEIGSLNGALVREAAQLGIAVPINRTIAALVRGIEARHLRGTAVDERRLEELAEASLNHGSPKDLNITRGTA
jgi:2-dehydropantoate 2-reductase